MAIGNLTGKYYYSSNGTEWHDFTSIAGVRVLSVDGFDERGETVNIYTAQWIDSDVEDYMCAKQETTTVNGVSTTRDVIVRKNVDLNLTVIVSRRYTNASIDEQTVYDSLVSTLCDGDIYIKSEYTGKIAHVVNLKSFKPTAVKLHRGNNSYILATIPLHTLSTPSNIPAAL